MTSNLRVDIWPSYLQHYQDRIIVDFLRYGWPINYKSPVFASSTFKNHLSALRNAVQLSSYISKELSYQSAFGPFRCNPFSSNCVISPLFCVPKSGSADLRFVHDLSFPEGFSVNDGISNELYLDQPFRLRLPGIDRLVDFVNAKGQGCLFFEKDLKRAFRQIPVDLTDYPLLGMCIDDGLYFHSSLPFGLRSTTMISQRTTKSIVYILIEEGISVDVYIDDFYGPEVPSAAEPSFLRLNSLFDELGVLASPDKDTPPCTHMICLGVWIDTLAMTLSVPDFRGAELREELESWLHGVSFTKRQLKRLIGKLSFVSACVRPGRAFMNRFLQALRSCASSSRHSCHPVTDDLRADISWWLLFLSYYNGFSVIPSNHII